VRVTGSKRRWLPRRTLRLRLTLLYGGLFLVAGAVLLAIVYGLVAGSVTGETVRAKDALVVAGRAGVHGQTPVPFPGPQITVPPSALKGGYVVSQQSGGAAGLSVQLRAFNGNVTRQFRKLTAAQRRQLLAFQQQAKQALDHQRTVQLDTLLTRSAVALGIMALLSIGLGYVMAGRALRPVRTMSTRARGISERNLHERLALRGPDDELKELADTFDGLLARLQTAFESQRRFVANASHELRTPITVERALVEVALADPAASSESLRDTCRRVLASSEQQERLIEALLTLARSQSGLAAHENFDLAAVAADVSRGLAHDGIQLDLNLEPAQTSGDPRLVERLVANLLDNGLKYNQEHGWVKAWTGVRDGRPWLKVENSGPRVDAEQVGQLVEPFRRLNGDRTANGESPSGLGLGLSIVDAIAAAHDAQLATVPRPEGGLRVEVNFPAV
jgi:signal transduction histidine kinase